MSKSKDKELSAVALKYEPDEQNAPCIVASGTGHIAQKIIQVAIENGVSIYHDESASTLLSKLDVGEEIPPELYQIVANIYITLLDVAEENSK
ncbi:MAG: type III secretion protein [Clostridiales bacterium]|jgi:flagellar biosynthesis protein|nr:type III secretion protein [Clostridiales bacterium]